MYFSRFKKIGVIFLISALTSTSAMALVSPVTQLNSVAQKLLNQLRRNQANLKKSGVVRRIARRVLMPHFDQNKIAASVVGRRHWFVASSGERSQFKRLFASLIINTYSAAFQNFNNDRVKFFPLRGSYRQRTVTVNSVLIRGNGQKIRMSYNVVRAGSRWKIYDFTIAGVSMVQSYRAQFASILARGKLRGLIARLRSRR